MTIHDPEILLALARQGYTDKQIAEVAGVMPEAIRHLVNGNGSWSGFHSPGIARGPSPSNKVKE
jgi:hypothetical protein